MNTPKIEPIFSTCFPAFLLNYFIYPLNKLFNINFFILNFSDLENKSKKILIYTF